MPIDYDAMRKELEKEKFDKEVQIANSEAQAMKNLGQQNRAQGFGSQGFGATQQAQVRNQAQNQYSQVNNDYFSRLMDIDEAEQTYLDQQEEEALNKEQTNASNLFQTFVSDTQGLYGSEFYDRAQAYGLVKQNSDGTYSIDMNSDTYKNLDTATQAYLQNYIMDVNTNGAYNESNLFDASNLDNQITYTNGKGETVTDTIQNKFRDETTTVLNNVRNGNIKSGDVVKLENASDGGVVYLAYRNGNLYYITEDQYNNSKGNKYETHGYSKTLSKISEQQSSNNNSNNDQPSSNFEKGSISMIGGEMFQGGQDILNSNFPKATDRDVVEYGGRKYMYLNGKWFEYRG